MPKVLSHCRRLMLALALCATAPVMGQVGDGRPAWPQADDGQRAHRPSHDEAVGSRNQAADAVRRAQAESGGRVLGAERVQFDGRDIMRVKVMDESGRVRYMDDDPSTRGRQHRSAGPERNDPHAQRLRGPNSPKP